MEKELNIAAILKDKPNIKVWSDTFGELTFDYIDNQGKFPICLTAKNGNSIDLTEKGHYYCDVEGVLPCIVPSKNMRSWEKFAWKKGDVLTDEERFVIFKGFNADDYTEFLHLLNIKTVLTDKAYGLLLMILEKSLITLHKQLSRELRSTMVASSTSKH